MAHLAGGAVGEVAHRVDGLAGRPCSDEEALAGQVAAGREQALDLFDDRLDLRQAALAALPGGERARFGLEDRHAPLAQRGDIGGDGDVVPHAAVHGGGHEDGAPRGQQERGEEVVGDAVGGLGEDIGRGRRHHEGVRPLGQRHVFDGLVALRVEDV